MAETVADTFFKRLIDWGGDTVFGLPGDGVNGIFEALRTHPEKIRFIQVRHEGGIHLLNGLYDAKFAGQPVLAITGHTFHDLIGTHFQQAMGLDKLFMDVAVYSQRIMGPAHVADAVDVNQNRAKPRSPVAAWPT